MRSLIPSYVVIVLAAIGAFPMFILAVWGIFFNSIYVVYAIIFAILYYVANRIVSAHLKEMYYKGKWKSYDDIFGD